MLLIRRFRELAIAVTVAGSTLAQAQPAAPAPAPATQSADALRLLDLWLAAQVAYDKVPALSAGVMINGELVWTAGYGAVDDQRRIRPGPDTLYSVCSISKLFTSVAVMTLWDSGRLALDDDISRYLPDFKLRRTDADSGPITIRSLLTHSSGLPREAAAGAWTAPDFKTPDREQMLAGLASMKTQSRASDHYAYSNLGMVVLGEVVAAVSGIPYRQYVQQTILDPLQLSDTRPVFPTDWLGTRLPRGHGALRRDGTREQLKPFALDGIAPAAGFTSSVSDLARFAGWQFRLLKTGGRNVLRASTLRDMHRVQWTDPDGKTTWGLGFAVNREGANTIVSHAGVCPGYNTAIAMALKDEVAVIALNNANRAGPYTRQMRQLVLKGMRLPVAPTHAGAPDLTAFSGSYDIQPWVSESLIVPWGRDLARLNLPSSDPAGELELLRAVGPDRFAAVREDGSLGAELVFSRDAAGRVTGYTSAEHFWKRLP